METLSVKYIAFVTPTFVPKSLSAFIRTYPAGVRIVFIADWGSIL